jgi:hypothetical protein
MKNSKFKTLAVGAAIGVSALVGSCDKAADSMNEFGWSVDNATGHKGANRQNWDAKKHFSHMISTNGDVATVSAIKSWRDYESDAAIQVILPDNTVFLASNYNTRLVDIQPNGLKAKDIACGLVGSKGRVVTLGETITEEDCQIK